MSYSELKVLLREPPYNYSRQLLLYKKGKRNESPTYLVSDKDLFPPNATPIYVQTMFTPVYQEEMDELGYNLSSYEYEGDITLMGGDDFDGAPPILGNSN
jgi:hypothetical protein